MNREEPARPDLDSLTRLFYGSTAELGTFEEVGRQDLPPVEKLLLGHHEHMTVTVEAYHGCLVDVQVLAEFHEGDVYARKILLTRQSDGRVVQFGIVRLHLVYLAGPVVEEILRRQTPLGRILIEHNVLRQVELSSLWRISPGAELRKIFGMPPGEVCYGRTALIHCNSEPAVELLEVVAPAG